uniref:Uncharacterized protein n=1 Tax=Strongyloides papillosus TaxID=174720 RepID=A0A0N5BVN0_STREA
MESENYIKTNFTNSSVLPSKNDNSTNPITKPDASMSSDFKNVPDCSKNNHIHSTPAIIKARRIHEQLHIQSPSDNMLSPCTKKLFSNKPRSKKISASHPINILRIKQQEALYNQKNE